MDHSPRTQHTTVGWALLLSLVLHVLGALYLQTSLQWDFREPYQPLSPTLELQFRASPPVLEPPVETPVPREPAPPELQRAPPDVPLTSPRVSPSEPSRTGLVLDLPDIVMDSPAEPMEEGVTENGAVVMNPELLSLLQGAERRSGYVPGAERDAAGDFQGGSWVEYIRDGDRCFRVVRADPLEPGSQDMWYRVACR